MNFKPTSKMTGQQVEAKGRNARESVLHAYASLEAGDFENEKYEERYSNQLVLSPSYLHGFCIWSLGPWQMYEPIKARA